MQLRPQLGQGGSQSRPGVSSQTLIIERIQFEIFYTFENEAMVPTHVVAERCRGSDGVESKIVTAKS